MLALSVKLARGQASILLNGGKDGAGHHWPGLPIRTGYVCFVGAVSLLAGLVGVASIFVEKINGVVTWGLDGLSALALLAGGILIAVGLKGTNCGNDSTLWYNDLVNAGQIKVDGTPEVACTQLGNCGSRCTMYKADDAFMFFGFLVTVAAVGLSFRSKSKGGSYV